MPRKKIKPTKAGMAAAKKLAKKAKSRAKTKTKSSTIQPTKEGIAAAKKKAEAAKRPEKKKTWDLFTAWLELKPLLKTLRFLVTPYVSILKPVLIEEQNVKRAPHQGYTQ